MTPLPCRPRGAKGAAITQETGLASRASLGWAGSAERAAMLKLERRDALASQREHDARLARLANQLPVGYCKFCLRPIEPGRGVCGDTCADGWERIVPSW
jgi:hypothetical protein